MTVSLEQATEVPGQTVLGLFFSREAAGAHQPPGSWEAWLFPWLSETVFKWTLLQGEQLPMRAASSAPSGA